MAFGIPILEFGIPGSQNFQKRIKILSRIDWNFSITGRHRDRSLLRFRDILRLYDQDISQCRDDHFQRRQSGPHKERFHLYQSDQWLSFTDVVR